MDVGQRLDMVRYLKAALFLSVGSGYLVVLLGGFLLLPEVILLHALFSLDLPLQIVPFFDGVDGAG